MCERRMETALAGKTQLGEQEQRGPRDIIGPGGTCSQRSHQDPAVHHRGQPGVGASMHQVCLFKGKGRGGKSATGFCISSQTSPDGMRPLLLTGRAALKTRQREQSQEDGVTHHTVSPFHRGSFCR